MKALAYGDMLEVVTDFMNENSDDNIRVVLKFMSFLMCRKGVYVCRDDIMEQEKQKSKEELPF